LAQSRVFVTGYQALIRACLMQQERDRLAVSTRGYVSAIAARRSAADQQFIAPKRARPPTTSCPERAERGPCGDRAVGYAAGRVRGEGNIRRRVRHVVRQGPGVDPTATCSATPFRRLFGGTAAVLALMGDDHRRNPRPTAHQSNSISST